MTPYLIYTDGSYYPNLGIAGYGFVIYEGEQKILNFFGENSTLEKSCNHEEYGILKALEKAQELSFKNIILLNDCKNLVEKLSIKSKDSKFEIKKSYFLDEIMDLFNYFDSIELQHICRKDNLADYYSRTFIHNKSKELKQENQKKIIEQKNLYFNHPKFNFIQNKLAHHLSLDKFNSAFRSSLIGAYAYKSKGLHIKWDNENKNFLVWHYTKVTSKEFNITSFYKVKSHHAYEFLNLFNQELKKFNHQKILLSVENLEIIANLVYLKEEKPKKYINVIDELYESLNHIDELFFLDDYIPLFCRPKVKINKKKIIYTLDEKIMMMDKKIQNQKNPQQKINSMSKLITMIVRNLKDKGEDINEMNILSLKEEIYSKYNNI